MRGMPYYPSHAVTIEKVWLHADETRKVYYTQDGRGYGLDNATAKQYDSLLAIP